MHKIIRKLALYFIVLTTLFGLFIKFSYAEKKNKNLFVMENSLSDLTKLNADIEIRFYVVNELQTIEKITKFYNLSLDIFYSLNPFYQFYPISKIIRRGTILRLPASALSEKMPPKKDNSNHSLEEIQKNENLVKNDESTEKIVETDISEELSDKLDNWLNTYIHSNISLKLDDNISLKNSEFNVLFPLVSGKNSSFFLQSGFHNFYDRYHSNLSLGFRHFVDHHMIGINGTIQSDLSEEHTRSAFGLEYANDFLYMSFNYYRPISDFKKSHFENWQAMPATAYSVEAQAYLPNLPSFSLYYSYEDFYNRNIDLNEDGNFQSNPTRHSLGIDYKPIPLFNLRANYNIDNQQNYFSTEVSLNFRFGIPFKDQIDSSYVPVMRSLRGRKNDFISHQRDIILSYEKNLKRK